MDNSLTSPQNLFFNNQNQRNLNLAPINTKNPNDGSLLIENMSGSIPKINGQISALVSPDNPLNKIGKQYLDDNLSLGMSPSIPVNQSLSPSPQFKFQGLVLHPTNSHHFEDSIDLKSQKNDSHFMEPLPEIKNENLEDMSILNKDNMQSQNLQFSAGILTQSVTNKGLKDSAFMMQSPHLEALENYLENTKKEEENKNNAVINENSRPGSGDNFLNKNKKKSASPTKSPMKSPTISPLKRFQQKLEEERLALIENIIKEEEEKKEFDQEFKKNNEEMQFYEKKIKEEIKSGKLKNVKKVEKDSNINEFKKLYHNLYLFNSFLRNVRTKYLFINLRMSKNFYFYSFFFLVCDQMFSKFCSYFKGRLMISKYFLIVAFFFTIILIGYVLGVEDVEYKTRSRTVHKLKKYMADNLLKASLITTYYGVL